MEAALCTLITGASSGIGRAAAMCLSRERRLILHGRDAARLEETRRLCSEPGSHISWLFDFRDPAGAAGSLGELLAGTDLKVEAFVHCAGVAPALPMRGMDYPAATEVMNVNFFSAAACINILLKKKLNGGHLANILFISSIWSRFGARGHSGYCASKAALDGLMRALAVELAPSVRVNSILPGAIETAMAAEGFANPEVAARLARDYPLGAGRPEDIAEAIAFVLSPRSRWLTGQQIAIDGGRTANMSL